MEGAGRLNSEKEIEYLLRFVFERIPWDREIVVPLHDGRTIEGRFWGVTSRSLNLRDRPSIGLSQVKGVGITFTTEGPE